MFEALKSRLNHNHVIAAIILAAVLFVGWLVHDIEAARSLAVAQGAADVPPSLPVAETIGLLAVKLALYVGFVAAVIFGAGGGSYNVFEELKAEKRGFATLLGLIVLGGAFILAKVG